MILFKSWLMGIILWILLPIAVFEDTGPAYDTSDWIPIVPDKTKSSNRESKSSDRILNVDASGERFIGEEKMPAKKTYITQHRPRKNPHIKRSPNQRPRIKLDQPYRFENILSPPPKQQLRGFQQKIPFPQSFNLQPQFQYNLPKPGQILNEEAYRQFPLPSNPSIYKLNNLQANPSIPNYSSAQLGIQYQQPDIVHQAAPTNNTVFQHSGSSSINQGLFQNIRNQNVDQNVKLTAPAPSEDKDTVQLLYVPLEQLQKQQGLLDEAFASLQHQKLAAPPPESDSSVKLPNAQPLVAQQNIQQDFPQQEVNQQKYQIQQNQPTTKEESQIYYSRQNSAKEPEKQTQYYVLQNTPQKNEEEQPRYYELVSKNRGELILQNNPKTVEVSNKQEYQVQAEKQQIVELTTPQPIQNHQVQYNTRFEHQERQKPQSLVQQTRPQDTRGKYLKKDPQIEQSFVVQNQVSQPLSVESPKLQHSYIVRNQPEQSFKQNYFQDDFKAIDQKSRLKNIQQDILQQTLQVEKLQKQIQQGKSLDFQENNISQPPKKRKPHQPPLAVYMGGNQPGDVESVLELLKNAKSIAVQDQIGPNSPQVFVGPSNLNVPEGFAKFPLPYLSSLDNNRIQRKAQQFPFFVAPINYKEPEGYSKIPLPSPHVGSVVVSQFRQSQIPNSNDNFQESNRPVAITNYKFVNPSFESTVDNSHFDDNLNAYSLESHIPRDNTNRHLKEQTLFQQITGFSGFDYPQNQYFADQRPNVYNQAQEAVTPKPQTNQNQYLEEVRPKPQLSSVEEIPQRVVSTPPSRQRHRGEKVRGNKKGGNVSKEANLVEEVEKSTQVNIPKSEIKVPEVPTPNIVQAPEKVEISSQNPLTQDFLNRFSSNNNFNFNYVSSTPGYAIPTQRTVEELPANIRKLNINQNQSPDFSNIRNSPVIDTQFEQTIENLQNSNQKFVPPKEEKRVHIYNGYEEYELPSQLTDINPNLPGLINELQQPQYTTPKLEADPPSPSTTLSTTQFTIRTTEATTTTTTRKPRGRGRSRFNMRTTTSSPYRRTSGERRRPSKTTVTPTTEASYENSFKANKYTPIEIERPRPRPRLQNSLTERVAEGSIESTSTGQQSLQPITRVLDIPQNQPNYYAQFQSSVANEKTALRDYVEEPKTEGVKVNEQYLSQKVTPAEQLAPQEEEYSPVRQISVKQPDRSEQVKSEVTQKPPEIEATTRRRVRVRGRPKNKYSSTTTAPRASTQENEQSEFYGFIRQPNFSQSSQISSNNRNQEEDIHIYAPTQQKSPIYNSRNNEPIGPSSPRSDTEPTRFLGELRPKYASPPRVTTTQQPETTQKGRIRGRVRIPGKSYESRSKSSDSSSTEKSIRGRARGRTHFTAPRNIRQETDNEETENYPAPYLKSREAATTPSSSEFKITVSTDDEEGDQIPYSSINKPEKSGESTTEAQSNPQSFGGSQEKTKNVIYKDEYEAPDDDTEIISFRQENAKGEGFRVVNVDQFDTAESQNYRTLFNSLEAPHKVNDLKSTEVEEMATELPKNTSDRTENPTTTGSPDSQKTSVDDLLNTTILESVRETIGNATVPSFFTTTEIQETTVATTTEDLIKESQNSTNPESTEIPEIASTTTPPEEYKTDSTTEATLPEQTPLDLLLLKTSTSTEISHETEICFKGRCVKSKNKKFRKRLLRKKLNETNNSSV